MEDTAERFRDARQAYFDECESEGIRYEIPAPGLTVEREGYIVLRNRLKTLAILLLTPDGPSMVPPAEWPSWVQGRK